MKNIDICLNIDIWLNAIVRLCLWALGTIEQAICNLFNLQSRRMNKHTRIIL